MIAGQNNMSTPPKILHIAGYRVELEPEGFAGVKYWAAHYQRVVPRFEVFVYVGQDRTKGVYFFKSRKGDNILYKSLVGLEASVKDKSFAPFMLETKGLLTLFDWED